MISEERYEKIKKAYGKVASWAVWAEEGDTPKSNVGDLSIFKNKDICKELNPDYIFVGLNVSGNGVVMDLPDWANFHSSWRTHNDFKLRYALKNTPYWGAYLTDVIKRHSNKNGGEVWKYLKDNPDVVKENIKTLTDEIECLGTKPVLVAMGGKVYQILKDYLYGDFDIVQIKHYSFTISKENYRKEVLEILQGH